MTPDTRDQKNQKKDETMKTCTGNGNNGARRPSGLLNERTCTGCSNTFRPRKSFHRLCDSCLNHRDELIPGAVNRDMFRQAEIAHTGSTNAGHNVSHNNRLIVRQINWDD